MNNLAQFILLFFFICACNQQNDKLIVIDLKSSGMGFQPDGKMVTLRASARLIFNNDIEIYIHPELHLNINYIKNNSGEVIDEKVISIDTTHAVYVRKKNQKYGIEYSLERLNSVPGISFNADSLFETLTFYSKGLSNYNLDIGRPKRIINKFNQKIEKYAIKSELGQLDSIYRFYDKSMKNIPYSFSKKLDIINDSKLYKIYGISAAIPKGVALPNMAVPKREFYHEMKVVSGNKNYIIYKQIIEQFKKDSEKMNLE